TENWSTTEIACWAAEASTASKTRGCLLGAHERGRRGGPGRKRHRTEGDGTHVRRNGRHRVFLRIHRVRHPQDPIELNTAPGERCGDVQIDVRPERQGGSDWYG